MSGQNIKLAKIFPKAFVMYVWEGDDWRTARFAGSRGIWADKRTWSHPKNLEQAQELARQRIEKNGAEIVAMRAWEKDVYVLARRNDE